MSSRARLVAWLPTGSHRTMDVASIASTMWRLGFRSARDALRVERYSMGDHGQALSAFLGGTMINPTIAEGIFVNPRKLFKRQMIDS